MKKDDVIYLATDDKLTEVFLLSGGTPMKEKIGLTGKLKAMSIYEEANTDGVVQTVASFKIDKEVVTSVGKAVVKVANAIASVFEPDELLKADITVTINSKKGANGTYPLLEVEF